MRNLIGSLLSNRYLIDSYIDEGGMSIIYKAVDIGDNNQYVAIKALKPDFSQDMDFTKRFFNEAKASYNMTHPNIVALLNADEDNGIYYLCFEYVEGPTLKQQIVRSGLIEPKSATRTAIQILWALNHAHSKGVIHRDIKPQNIIMHPSGNAKVLDFGIARMPSSHTLTDGKTAIGTVDYVSPEQAMGGQVGPHSDIYSMGIVLYEMLTGVLPFNDKDTLAILAKQINENPVPPTKHNPHLDKSLEYIILAAMMKKPEDRYQNASEMIEDLNSFLQGNPPKYAINILKAYRNKQNRIHTNPLPNTKESPRVRAINKTKRSVRKHYRVFIWAIPLFLVLTTAILLWGVSWISSLTKVVYAPDLTGMEHVKAIETTNMLGIKPMVRYLYHNTVSENRVIDQSPIPQERMNIGDTLVINVSRGKQQESTPKLEGLSLREAYEKASELKFTLAVVERVVSVDKAEDIIIQQMTKVGAPLPSDRILQVIVSGGAASVPDVMNLALDAASKLINNHDLVLGTVEYEDVEDEKQEGKVLRQVPEAGSQVIAGSKINLKIARYPNSYNGTVEVKLKNYTGNIKLRIVLLEGNTEVEKHSQSLDASNLEVLRIPVESKFEGSMTARIYIDDVLVESLEVELK